MSTKSVCAGPNKLGSRVANISSIVIGGSIILGLMHYVNFHFSGLILIQLFCPYSDYYNQITLYDLSSVDRAMKGL